MHLPAAPSAERTEALRDLARLIAAWLVEDHLAGRLPGVAGSVLMTKETSTKRTTKKIRVR